MLPKEETIKFVKFSPTIDGDDTTKNLILSSSYIRSNFDVGFNFKILYKNRIENLGSVRDDVVYSPSVCQDSVAPYFVDRDISKYYNCRTFAKHYKQLIDKSMFKDKIYKHLQNQKINNFL